MLTSSGRLAVSARFAVLAVASIAIVTPATAQLGGLRKRIKPAAKQETTPTPANDGGMVVLTSDVVNQLLTGLKAGQVERDAAIKEDTPYGRFKKADVGYADAKVRCDAAQQTFIQRMSGNEKMLDKYQSLTEKMVAAQGKGDMKLQAIYQDSAMAMQDPGCIVKKPEQPKDYYEAERAIEARAEAKEAEASGFSVRDLAVLKERAIGVLRNTEVPGGASASEKSAVAAKSTELKPLLGMREPAPVQAAAPAPEAAPTPAAAQPSPEMAAQASSMSDCMVKNVQTHQARIEALGKRAQAAQKAGNQQKLMAIADTLQRIQMAGCR